MWLNLDRFTCVIKLTQGNRSKSETSQTRKKQSKFLVLVTQYWKRLSTYFLFYYFIYIYFTAIYYLTWNSYVCILLVHHISLIYNVIMFYWEIYNFITFACSVWITINQSIREAWVLFFFFLETRDRDRSFVF